MATAALQLEILNILKIKMPETEMRGPASEIKDEHEVIKRKHPELIDLETPPLKKLKPSKQDDINEENVPLNTIELVKGVVDDDTSTESENISEDDDIQIVNSSHPVSTISSELMSIVDSILAKEVVENMEGNKVSNNSFNLSGDTGFASDDNSSEKVFRKGSDAEGVEESIDTSDENVDCLLLSSPVKRTTAEELVLNPLYSSEDSSSSFDTREGNTSSTDNENDVIEAVNEVTNSVDTVPTVSKKDDMSVNDVNYKSDDDDDVTVLEINPIESRNDNAETLPDPSFNLKREIVKTEIDEKDVKNVDIVERSDIEKGPCKLDAKIEAINPNFEESKPKIEKTKSQVEVSSSKSIILVSIDDEEEIENEESDEKISKLEKNVEALKEEVKPSSKSNIDLTRIKKCYVHCERAKIPAGVPVPQCDDCPKVVEDVDDEIELLDPYPRVVALPCSVCGQAPDRVSFFSPGSGLDEATAVRDERISVISWEESVQNDWPPSFKATNLCVYDSMGHLVPYDGGLIEQGQRLFFSGYLMNIIDDSETLEVDRIGPLTGWRRPDGKHISTTLILTTCLEGTEVEYHVDTKDFSTLYKAALQKERLYKSFAQVLSKVPSKNRNVSKPPSIKTDVMQSKVQNKSANPQSSTPKTSITLTTVAKKSTRNVKRKPSGSDLSGDSDDDWNPEKNKTIRKSKRAASPESSDEDSKAGSNSYFNQIKRKVPTVLKSLDSSPGCGKGLAKLLPGHQDSQDPVAAFLKFICERQCIWVNKSKGVVPMTKNKVMLSKWFTNMYREIDRGTIYFRRCILDTVLRDVDIDQNVINESLVSKVLFRSIVYRLINKVETFNDFGGLPDLEEFPKFLKFLAKKKDAGVVIFTAAHQNMGFNRLMKTFEYVKKNVKKLSSEIVSASKKRSIKKCQEILLQIPNVGAFFAWQILCDLLECRILGACTDNQWACLGPGAKNGLRRIFPLATTKGELKYTRLLRDLCTPSGPGSGFQALGLNFPAFLHKPLSLKNVEHALCEYDKYFRSALGVQIKEREYSVQKSRVGLDQSTCGVCDKACSGVSRVMCALCSVPTHKKCTMDWKELYHADGTWLCRECHKSEQAWVEEDFKYEEIDKNDEIEKAFFSGAAKKEARLKRKEKKKEKKVKRIECIDLSSDEDDDDEAEEEGSDDEIEYLESVKGHFFGVDFDETVNDEDGTINVDEDEEDPFAGVGVWVTSDDGDSKESDVNGLDEEILILS